MEEVPLGDLVVEEEAAAEEAEAAEPVVVGAGRAGVGGRRGSIMLPATVVVASCFQGGEGGIEDDDCENV